MDWNYEIAKQHIENKLDEINDLEIIDYTRDVDIENIPRNRAYKVNGVHVYLNITNIKEVLEITKYEGEKVHKETIRILDLFYKLCTIALKEAGAILVDFHNHRLHAVFTKPYNSENGSSEKKRIENAISYSNFMANLLKKAHEDISTLPELEIKIGVDSGVALAVNNGRRGYRHPLFLGNPANRAAKMLQINNHKTGIVVPDELIDILELKEGDYYNAGNSSIKLCNNYLEGLSNNLDSSEVINKWKDSLENYDINNIEFSRTSYPIKNLNFSDLTPHNSKRQELISVYADISGFTKYIHEKINIDANSLVKIFHVIKAEMDRVFESVYEGKRVRFIGDCIHGLIFNGTSYSTNEEKTVYDGTYLVASLRSSFDLTKKILTDNGFDVEKLGLTIGFELGHIAISGLGIKGERVVSTIGRAILESEEGQYRCENNQTAIGEKAYKKANKFIQDIFKNSRISQDLTIDKLDALLADAGEPNARKLFESSNLSEVVKDSLSISNPRYSMKSIDTKGIND